MFILSTLLAVQMFSIIATAQDDQREGLVELHIETDRPKNYEEYRSSWSVRFGIAYERMQPNQWTSSLDGSSYASDFGSSASIPLVSGNLGLQKTLGLGTFYGDVVYGRGAAPAQTISNANLSLTKMGLGFGYFMDTYVRNPWIIPFGGVQLVEFGWQHAVSTLSAAGTTASTTVVLGGISVPLGLIDEDSARRSARDYGLNETYLDIFAIEYMTSNSAKDPDFQTGVNLAAGLHFVF